MSDSSDSQDKPRLFSRLAAPIAKAARLVTGRGEDDDGPDGKPAQRTYNAPEPLTDEAFQLAIDELLTEDNGQFQIKLHVISLVEFREAVGERWAKVSEKVMLIAEGVINMHVGAGNMVGRRGNDLFILLFRTCDLNEARRRAHIIAEELGTRLVGDQFLGAERPLALAAELDLADSLTDDGELDLTALHDVVGEVRAMVSAQAKGEAPPPPTWLTASAAQPQDQAPRLAMGPCAPAETDPGLRRHMMPGEAPADSADGQGVRRHMMPGEAPPAPVETAPAGPPPKPITEEREISPGEDPGWQPLESEQRKREASTDWVAIEVPGRRKTAEGEADTKLGPPRLPADAKLALIWRPTWVSANETVGAYKAHIQRVDMPGSLPLEGVAAYPRDDESAANTLDRFCIANAIRDFRASEATGNRSTIIIPVHWATLTSPRRMDYLSPFADVTQEARGARIVIDLFGIPAIATPAHVATTVQNARALCREVILRVRLSTAAQTAFPLDCGITMIGLDMSELEQDERTDDTQLLDSLKRIRELADKARLGTYAWGIRRRTVVAGAVRAGFSMINGPALMRDIPKPAKVIAAPKSRLIPS